MPKNRERVFRQSFYDLLDNMNETLQGNEATIKIPETDCIRAACIIDCFEDALHVSEICKHDCKKCVADWLNNESPF